MHAYILWNSDDLSHLRSYTEVDIEWVNKLKRWINKSIEK